jgi:hypothetical protein
MSLSADQVSTIRKVVEDGYITLRSLKDDLVDHLCCEVECGLNNGDSFENSLSFALKELAPKGLKQIQHETNVLLQTKTEINMKRITYATGLLTAMTMSLGWLLKILNFGGIGNMLFALGAFGFVIFFLPLLAYGYFKSKGDKKWSEKLRLAAGMLSLVLVGLALLARIMHLPGADEVLLAGGLVFTFGFLPFLFLGFYKKSISQTEG